MTKNPTPANAAIPTLLPVYKRIDIQFDRGEGTWLYDKAGQLHHTG